MTPEEPDNWKGSRILSVLCIIWEEIVEVLVHTIVLFGLILRLPYVAVLDLKKLITKKHP